MTTIFVTKYWGTRGIITVNAEHTNHKGMYRIANHGYAHPGDYALTMEEARVHVIAAAKRRITLLRKQIAKMEKIASGTIKESTV